MTALATVDDLNVLLGTEFGEADTRPVRLLELASSLVRAEARQTISLVEADVATLRVDGEVKLPELPVLDVAVVKLDSWWGSPGPQIVTGYEFTPWGELTPSGNIAGIGWYWPLNSTMEVTYDHGYDPVPDDVIAVVCATVGRLLEAPTGEAQSESIGGYSVSNAAGAFSDADRSVIRNRYRPRSYTTRVRSAG